MDSKMFTGNVTYFSRPGKENTEETFQLARRRADELGIKTVIVASTKGETGAKAVKLFRGFRVIVVTHSHGFAERDKQELDNDEREAIESGGGLVLTTTHAFAGVPRAIRKKFNTYETNEIIAYTLRIFGEGMKVVCEIALMSADAGLVKTSEDIISIGGTGRGADTAVVLKPANTQDFFDLRIKEIICKPKV
jgi:uncharacterized protein